MIEDHFQLIWFSTRWGFASKLVWSQQWCSWRSYRCSNLIARRFLIAQCTRWICWRMGWGIDRFFIEAEQYSCDFWVLWWLEDRWFGYQEWLRWFFGCYVQKFPSMTIYRSFDTRLASWSFWNCHKVTNIPCRDSLVLLQSSLIFIFF